MVIRTEAAMREIKKLYAHYKKVGNKVASNEWEAKCPELIEVIEEPQEKPKYGKKSKR